ncbi:pyridoxamine 5'-phosphate oxidase family protein [Rhodococcus pyridinivorans]|uniref:pyridoxamine 5'-phosphate oxidase family protein n=1 Tax=Rhodococcus pyridinivorans TaxID=103816 RepID=UPI000BA1D907|nr:pyridoxamine 5'-phosphate oxidase family protein [Rhodococcus pyridinivorans]
MVKDNVRSLHSLLSCVETVMLTTIDDHYWLISRPMMLQIDTDLQSQGILHLFAPARSRAITHIAARAAVNVSFASLTRSVSLSGTADFTTDRATVERAWHDRLDPWFPHGAAQVALIEVTIDEARLWNSPDAVAETRWHVG